MSKFFATVVLILGQAPAAVPAMGADRLCTPDITWTDVPLNIRTQIAQAVGGEISPQGGPFNSTDVVRDSTPRARFFGACRESSLWTIALERGGIGYHLEVFKFSGSALTEKWTAFVPANGFTPSALAQKDER
ncbi:hypothetical protein [Xanthomonas maliensis]|uniref:hypothetical protein n=1 Tax=Xanthomonas maliensis TaxID=1321368 RepID=UPI0012656031|nr:hypothetical protein [Xanthomonas maliensis]